MTNMEHRAGMARQPDDPGHQSARAGARAFVRQLEDAVRENPVPAALIGMGCLWMFMGGNKVSLFGANREGPGPVSRAIGRAGDAAFEVAQRGGSSVTRAAGHAAEALSDLGTRAAEMTRGAAASVGDAVAATSSLQADTVSSANVDAGSVVVDAVEAVSGWATKASQAAQHAGADWGRSAQQSLAELFERQPLVLGAIGLAIGAGIAASLPTSEAETRFMGDASETLKEKAHELATDKAQQVKSAAERALQEAEDQGLTRAAGDAVRGLTDKVVGVAEAAGRSLNEQLNPEKSGANSDRVDRTIRPRSARPSR
jgi:hypothetical protein